MMTMPLDFTPGTKYAYSNFGYCVLGRIIEKITGVRYEDYVKRVLLAPMGITDMQTGHTQIAFRAPNEVHYYDDYDGMVQSVFPNITEPVPYPYGGFYLESFDSLGAWIASAQDLVQFAVSIDGARLPAYLQPATLTTMLARDPKIWSTTDHWYALGWQVTYPNWWHDGAIGGSRALLVRIPNGIAWAVLFNKYHNDPKEDYLFPYVDRALWNAFYQVTSWPSWDLFPNVITTISSSSATLAESESTVWTTLTASSSMISSSVGETSSVNVLPSIDVVVALVAVGLAGLAIYYRSSRKRT